VSQHQVGLALTAAFIGALIGIPLFIVGFMAKGGASEEEALTHYRRVRDEIRAFVEGLSESLQGKGTVG